jgi:hypothetical protein
LENTEYLWSILDRIEEGARGLHAGSILKAVQNARRTLQQEVGPRNSAKPSAQIIEIRPQR